jgi:hypothetical protein
LDTPLNLSAISKKQPDENNQAFFVPEEVVFNLMILNVFFGREIKLVKNWPKMS